MPTSKKLDIIIAAGIQTSVDVAMAGAELGNADHCWTICVVEAHTIVF